jgi:Ala-tRNA(Pro) deacylase
MVRDMTRSPEDLFDLLEKLRIKTETHHHEAVFTVEESHKIKQSIPGGHTKNLFVKDKKGQYFLIVAEQCAVIPINRIHSAIGARSRLSFASADSLREYLGVEPGSVTAFAPMNDVRGIVKVIIDEPLLKHDLINCHPLTNTMTTTISKQDLLRFLEHVDHPPAITRLSENHEEDLATSEGQTWSKK